MTKEAKVSPLSKMVHKCLHLTIVLTNYPQLCIPLYHITFPLTCLLTTKVVTTNITTGCAKQAEDRAQWGHEDEKKIMN